MTDAMVPGIFLDSDADRAIGNDRALLRQVSDAGISVTKAAEGWRRNLYNDVVGYCSIGYGHLVKRTRCNGTEPANFRAGLSEPDGVELLYQDVRPAEAAVATLVTKEISDPQFAALVDFVYNCGIAHFRDSTLLKMVNARPDQNEQVAAQFRAWDMAGGKVIAGLEERRDTEIALYFTGMAVPAETRSLGVAAIDIRVGER